MIYTEQTQKAMQLCYQAHLNQVDKGGVPYVFHPIHLAEQMDDEISTVVALLHDVVEDTPCTFADLEQMGFDPEALAALKLLTHAPEVEYMDYIRRIAGNPIARKVKLADLEHNLDVTRMRQTEKTMARRKKYQAAKEILLQVDDRCYQDRIRGCFIGGAAGDALGYEVEFLSADSIFNHFGDEGITEYVLHKGVAEISDDTQMTLFTAAGLLVNAAQQNRISAEEDIHRAYLDWLSTQYRKENLHPNTWLANVPALHNCRAPGNTCLSALISGQMGSVFEPINYSKGCGGVMRVAPIGLMDTGARRPDVKDVLNAMELGAAAAAITHGHPLGYIPAAALVQIVCRTVFGGCKYGNEPAQILRECRELLLTLYGESEDMDRMLRLMDQAQRLAGKQGRDVDLIHSIGGGWVGEEALAIALFCWLRYPGDFDRAVIAAVNHSGDSDSTGAILGNIMGAALGYEALGEKWKRNLELHDVILEVADDLYHACRVHTGESDGEQAWAAKYLSRDFAGETRMD